MENKPLETDIHKCSQMIFYQKTKAIQWRQDSLFNKWSTQTSLHTKIYSKQEINIDLNVTYKPYRGKHRRKSS